MENLVRKQSQQKQEVQQERLEKYTKADEENRRRQREAQAGVTVIEAMTAGFEWVTPVKAEEWLLSNPRNRKLRKAVVRKYASMMGQGDWLTTGDSIVFDVEGRLLNGQHRLEAIIHSGARAYLLVVRGMPTENQLVMDRPQVRMPHESLALEGVIGISRREVAIARAMKYNGRTSRGGESFEPPQIKKFVIPHISAMNFVLNLVGHSSMKIMSAAVLAALIRGYYHVKKDRLKEFIEILLTRKFPACDEDRAPLLLREFLMEKRSPRGRLQAAGGEPFRVLQYKKTQAALRAFYNRKPIQKLMVARATVELFPLPGEH